MIGRRKFFSRAARHIEGLPEGYTAVEYIQSSGTQYIDTGRKLTQDSDITIDFSIVGEINRSAGIFGSRQSASKNNLTLFQNADVKVLSGDFSEYQKHRFTAASSLERTKIQINKAGVWVNDILKKSWSDVADFETPTNGLIFDVGNNNWTNNKAMLILAAVFAVFGFFNMRERVPLMSREEIKETSVLESLKNIITNRPLLAVILANFFNSFKSVGGSSESYFWLNNTGSLLNQTICGLFTGIPNYIMVPIAAKMVKKWGARATSIIAGLFGFFAYMTLFFVGFHPFGQTFKDHYIFNLIWVIFGLTICGLPNKILNVSGQIVTAEALDYMEWKHGLRNEALVTTVQGYFGKLATSVTGWLSGMVLTWINYVPLTDSLGNAVPQTDPTMLNGIWAVFCILPALARGLYGVSFIIYPIHGDLQQQMIIELAEKRAQRLAEQEAKDHQA